MELYLEEEKMSKSKVHMPEDIKMKCHAAIHSASAAAAAAGAIPIPMSDTIPITGAQIGMVIALGKVFDVSLSKSLAESIAKILLAQQVGRAVFVNALKFIPGAGTIIGGVIGATTAAGVTELLGWIVADDFYRLSNGEELEDLAEVAGELKDAFKGARMYK